jgi:uncharacterized membrane protein
MSIKIKQNKTIIILTIIILLSIFLNFNQLGKHSYWIDEEYTSKYASDISNLPETLKNDHHPPLYYLIVHFSTNNYDDKSSLRYTSAIFGVLLVLAVFILSKQLFDENIALFSSFIVAISVYLVIYSQVARMYTLLSLLSLLMTYFFLKYLDSSKKKYLVLFILTGVMAVYTHYLAFSILLFLYLYLIYKTFKDKAGCMWFIKKSLGFVTIFLFFLPWIPQMLHQFKSISGGVWGSESNYFSVYLFYFNPIYFDEGLTIEATVACILFILSLIAIFFTLLHLYKKKHHDVLVFSLIVLLTIFLLAPGILSICGIFYQRYVFFFFPFFVILFSKGLLKNKYLLIVFVSLYCSLMIYLLYNWYYVIPDMYYRWIYFVPGLF